jgi:hypothetical protein
MAGIGLLQVNCIAGQCSNQTSGGISIRSGGTLSIASLGGTFGQAFIGSSDAMPTSDISVTTMGDITLSATGSDNSAWIGNYGFPYVGTGEFGGDIAVTSTNGAIALDASHNGTVLIGDGIDYGVKETNSTTISAQTLSGDIWTSLDNDLAYGNFALDLTGTQLLVIDRPVNYAGGNTLTLSNGGDIVFDASVQNAGNGAIDINSGGTITIGGAGATGNVAIGSAGGTTTIDADDLLLVADNGYAHLGFAGAADGAVDVTTTGDVTIDGGSGANDFAQIGNGGYQTTGSESGAITIEAGGDIALSGGSGALAYAQIGNGGADSNANSKGYSDTGDITLSGDNIVLKAGSGNAAYVQIGNGGYEVGKGLTGNGTESGNITLSAVNSVTLDGNGTDAYAQIGNGGDQVDLDASAAAGGGATGDVTITLTATGGSVTLAAGAGSDAYAQIGDGGYAEDTPDGNAANFLTGGDIGVSASTVSLTGGNGGDNAYAQIGNGDAAMAGDANVDGDVTINQTAVVSTTDGTASGGEAVIGNATGTGSVSGTAGGGGNTQTTETVDTVTVLTQSDATAANDLILTVFAPIDAEQPQYQAGTDLEIAPPPLTPLEQMANASSNGDNDYEGTEPSDDLVTSLGQSLDPARGRRKNAYVTVRTLVPGLLKEIVTSNVRNPRGVPAADEDYSSWGNEALWK